MKILTNVGASPPQKSFPCSDELNARPILAQKTFLLGRYILQLIAVH